MYDIRETFYNKYILKIRDLAEHINIMAVSINSSHKYIYASKRRDFLRIGWLNSF